MKPMIAATLLAVAGCATASADAGGDVGGEAPRQCNADPVQNLVGRPATAELGQDALARSNSRGLRWIRPGDAVTMDYREDRLNIHLDARGAVERITCG